MQEQAKIMQTELVYTKAKLYKRIFAFFIDQFLIFFLTFVCFSITNMILPHIENYQVMLNERYEVMEKSHLYNDKHILIIDEVKDDEQFKDYNEKKSYLSDAINLFYHEEYFFSDISKINEEYATRKLEYKFNGINLFEKVDGEVVEKSGNYEGLYNFYLDEINDYSLKYLFQNDIYINSTRIIFLISILIFIIWLIIFISLFYLLFPLVVFKRGRQTIGRKIFSISLISVDALNITTKKYLLRYLFILFVMYILDFFSFLIPLLVSLAMMFISKRNQDLTDYIFNTYVVDSKNEEIYLDYADYISKNNRDKKLKLEDKNFNPHI